MSGIQTWIRAVKAFVTYGVLAPSGKAFALFVILTGPVQAEEVTVLALGDSLTQGFGLVEAEGFVPQLQNWLDQAGAGARVINGGVSGDTTAGGAARVEWSLTPDVDAMIVALGGNDLLRGLDPGLSRANLEQIVQVAQAREIAVLLVGLQAPGNYGPDFKAAFDGMFPALAAEYDLLLFENFFAGLGTDDLTQARGFFQADGIHPNAAGVARIVDRIGPQVLELISEAR